MVGQSDNQFFGSSGTQKPWANVKSIIVTGSHSKAMSTPKMILRAFIVSCATIDSFGLSPRFHAELPSSVLLQGATGISTIALKQLPPKSQ